MKKVLVTGADGFIGSHLAERLINQGYEVRSLCLYNSWNSWGWLDNSKFSKDMEIVTGDIRDPFLCKEITKDIDSVFHLAALIAIPYSYRAPQSYIETNITGTLNMVQGAMENGVTRFMHTSTSEVYGTAMSVPIAESHPLQPQSPYSASKIAADAIALSYYHAFDFPLFIARPFNTYGPRQSARAIIPTIISQIAAGETSIKLGDVTPTRDFNYVSDTCDAMIGLVMKSDIVGKALNIGSGKEISIQNLFELINRLMGSDCKIQKEDERIRPANSEVHRLLCDNTLLNQALPNREVIGLEEGLQKTIEWFTDRENLKHYKTGIYNV